MAGDEEWGRRFADRGVTSWAVRASKASVTFDCGTFPAAGELAARLTQLCEEFGHHPEIDVRYPGSVTVTTWSHDVGGLSQRDLDLAKHLNTELGV